MRRTKKEPPRDMDPSGFPFPPGQAFISPPRALVEEWILRGATDGRETGVFVALPELHCEGLQKFGYPEEGNPSGHRSSVNPYWGLWRRDDGSVTFRRNNDGVVGEDDNGVLLPITLTEHWNHHIRTYEQTFTREALDRFITQWDTLR